MNAFIFYKRVHSRWYIVKKPFVRQAQFDGLLVLNLFFFERRIDLCRTAQLIQKGESQARAVLERLHERGLIEGRGEKRGRVYILSGALYQRFKTQAEYVRANGFDLPQMEQMALEHLHKHGRISRSDIADLCKINEDQAYRLLRKLTEKHPQIQSRGAGKNTYYVWIEQ